MRKKLVLFYSLICGFTSFGITTSRAQEMHRLNVRPDSVDIKELVHNMRNLINNADRDSLTSCSDTSGQNP